MKHFTFDNVEIPKLGLGTWQSKGDECVHAVRNALDTGYRHVDTAQIYDNEQEVGEGLKKAKITRDDIFVTTKVWRDRVGKGDLLESVKGSLKKLQTDYVDLLLLHWPVDDVPLDEQLDGLKKAQEEGLTRLVGVSNYTVDLMKKVVEDYGLNIATNQVEFHPFLSQNDVLSYLKNKNMFLTAYCPLAQGDVLKNPKLKEIGLKYGLTAPQVAILWEYQQDNVVTIPKSSSKEHIESNLKAIEKTLSPEDVGEIAKLQSPAGRLIDPDWAPQWDAA